MERRTWHESYDEGVPVSLEYEELSLPAMLRRSGEQYADAPAIAFLNARLTYGQLWAEVRRFASSLRRLGVEPGTRVAIQLPNIPQAVIGYYAALLLGAEVVMTNPLYTPRELEHQWTDSSCKVAIVADFLYAPKVQPLREKVPVEHFILARIPEYLRFPLNLLAPLKLKSQEPPLIAPIPDEPNVHRFRDLAREGSLEGPWPEIDLDSPACLQYTGGTTGVSKGAVLTHRNLSWNIQQIHAWFRDVESGKEVMLTCLPLFHVFGMNVAMNWSVYSATKMVLVPNPRDIPLMIKNIVKHKVSIFPGVPAMFNAMNNTPGVEGQDLSSIKACFSGSAPIAIDVLERFEQMTGATIVEGFGMTETSPVTHVNPLFGQRKIGKIGVPISDTEARVVDVDSGQTELPAGQEGELVLRGPQVMQGYWGRPDETASTIKDGWLHTGDLATVDEDGYFAIVGRKKDMIIRGGYNVYPDEVDDVLMGHEGILEAATIGVPDEGKGELVKSFVVSQPGTSLTEDTVRDFCREHLAAYKVPSEVEFLEELPKSSVLKILRRELRDRELSRRAAPAE